MNMKLEGFRQELQKSAAYGRLRSVGRSAKSALPWAAGLTLLEEGTKGPHVSLESSKERASRIGKGVATIGTDIATFDLLQRRFDRKNKLPSFFKQLGKARTNKYRKNRIKAIRRAGSTAIRKTGRFGLAITGGMLAGSVMRRLLGAKPPKEIPLKLRKS